MAARVKELHEQGDNEAVKLIIKETNLIANCADDPDYEWLYIPEGFGTHLAVDSDEL